MLTVAGLVRCDVCGASTPGRRLERLANVDPRVDERLLRPGITGAPPAGLRYLSHGWCGPESWERAWWRGGRRVHGWTRGRRLVIRCGSCVSSDATIDVDSRQLILFADEATGRGAER